MLGTNIREYRKKQKLTMKELAERTGLSIGYISQVERGRQNRRCHLCGKSQANLMFLCMCCWTIIRMIPALPYAGKNA